MSNRIYICSINAGYLDYLHQFDKKVSEDKKRNRKFVGVLLEINEKKYYAPLSSPKLKHTKISDEALDIFKIDGGRLGVINLNNMIPVPNIAVIRLDIENEPDVKYKDLLRNQAKIIHSNRDDIMKKAKRLYSIVNSGSQPILNSRCYNYKLLESKTLDFVAVIEKTAGEVAVVNEDITFPIEQIAKMKKVLTLLLILFLTACSANTGPGDKSKVNLTGNIEKTENTLKDIKVDLIDKEGKTVQERIKVPDGFERIEVEAGSFGEYLRNLPLKPHSTKVKYYNGGTKHGDVYEAVIDIDVGDRDLQQCADAVMRLRAEYLYGKGLFDSIHFNFTNGFKADYATWRQGNRIMVEGNNAYWVKQTETSNDYDSFRRYLDMVFAYAGTLSLSQEMKKVPLPEMQIGDVFLKGENPGHCVIILDMAENKDTGGKLFIIAQSYMPAQDIHVLKNLANGEGNPWYSVNFGDKLNTPEWEFTKDQLVRFED